MRPFFFGFGEGFWGVYDGVVRVCLAPESLSQFLKLGGPSVPWCLWLFQENEWSFGWTCVVALLPCRLVCDAILLARR